VPQARNVSDSRGSLRACLAHPGIRLLDAGLRGAGQLYLVLENVEGLLATNLRIETGSRKRAELLVLQMLAFEPELSYLLG
jgi:hypothetical protein